MIKGLFHIHSRYSFDSVLSPKSIVRYGEENGYSIVAITDHNTIAGSVEASHYAASTHAKLKVIIGAEYSTDKGDIIGLLLKEEAKGKSAEEIITNIKSQGGIVVLPHPFRGHRLDEELIRNCDIIEIFNSRVNQVENEKAFELAKYYKKPALVGSDAHFRHELSSAIVTFIDTSMETRDTILFSERIFETSPSSWYYTGASQMIKACKTRDFNLARETILSFLLWLGFRHPRSWFKAL